MKKRVYYNPVIGDKATLLKSAEETNGEVTLLEVVVNAGGGNILHRHVDYAEKFEVLEGDLTVTLKAEKRILRPGDVAVVPANTLHCFNNFSKHPVKFLVQFNPAQPGFERAIAIGYGLAADGLVDKRSIPRDLRHQALLFTMSGMVPSGFGKLLVPLLRLIAATSRRVKRELINRYC
ncbi:MAG TPA: cupin domain-containing protein [Chryseolinea sp.]|nr:cupin domain-containing protein [Chryseolinea sp.]